MRRNLVLCTLAVLSTIASAQESLVYVFQDASAITLDAEEILPGQTVAVADERIDSMGAEGSVTMPPDAVVIDASGRFLMPGLAEMHGHVPSTDDPQYLEDVRFLYVANGVTAVRRMQGRVGTINQEPGSGRRLVDLRNGMVRIMHEEGVGLLPGSDAPQFFNVPGFSLHNELAYMVEAGPPPHGALHMGTAAPADFFGAEDEFGRIAAGLAAGLVLLAENPLEDVSAASRPLGVMVRGERLGRGRIDAGLEAIAARHRRR